MQTPTPEPPRSCAPPRDSSAASQQPPIPAEKAIAAKQCEHGHAPQEHAKWNLISPQRDRSRYPCPASRLGNRLMVTDHAAMGALDPDRQHRGQTENGSGNRAGE